MWGLPVLWQVIQIMAQASSGLVTAPSPKSPEWTAAHNVLTSLQQLALASRGGMLTPGQVADFKQRLHSEYLPALAAAATLMQRQREERPWIEQAQELLEEGLAAATRSCAYLRCANLGGGGGPAAGQGTSSAKCRWGLGCGTTGCVCERRRVCYSWLHCVLPGTCTPLPDSMPSE